MWHHLVLPWLHHYWCRKWEGDCSQTTIPEESCQHSQNVFMSINSSNFNESLARIVWVKGWGFKRAWQSDESEVGSVWPFCFHKHERYSSAIIPTQSFGLVRFCVPKTPKSGLSSGRCPCGRNKALLDKSLYKQIKPLSAYSCALHIHASLYSFSQSLQLIKGGTN